MVDSPIADGVRAPVSPVMITALVTATLGGQSVPISFAGLAPRLAGVFQVSIQIPNLPPGDYPLDDRSLIIYTMKVSSILYFHRKTTGSALISLKY
jgi:hypothetical protein